MFYDVELLRWSLTGVGTPLLGSMGWAISLSILTGIALGTGS